MTQKIKANANTLWFTVPYDEAELQTRLQTLDKVVVERIDTVRIGDTYYRVRFTDNVSGAILRAERTDDGTIVRLEYQDKRYSFIVNLIVLIELVGLAVAIVGVLLKQLEVTFIAVWLVIVVVLQFVIRREGLGSEIATGFMRGTSQVQNHQLLFDYLVVNLSQ
ncbi:MAG: hypothetical protein H6670_01685 [Anaerolineaceae bacterium]|nr:hypothetical protein [Anaerolineaceae bacterium]